MFDYYVLQNQMHWMPESVPLHTDVKDWQELTPVEKNLLTQIFRLFTQSDVDVGSGYVDKYMPLFKKPEARMMMGSFANMESIHQHAYSLLLKRCQTSMTMSVLLNLQNLRKKLLLKL
jgi:ribonucleoside-diphosphate reductase beta chain